MQPHDDLVLFSLNAAMIALAAKYAIADKDQQQANVTKWRWLTNVAHHPPQMTPNR